MLSKAGVALVKQERREEVQTRKRRRQAQRTARTRAARAAAHSFYEPDTYGGAIAFLHALGFPLEEEERRPQE